MKQEDIITFQKLSQELEHLQEHNKRIDDQIAEVMGLLDALTEFKNLKEGSNILFPIANGIFAQGTITNNKELKINVGKDVVVNKTVDEAYALVKEQLDSLKAQQDAMSKRETTIYDALETLETQVRKEQEQQETQQ